MRISAATTIAGPGIFSMLPAYRLPGAGRLARRGRAVLQAGSTHTTSGATRPNRGHPAPRCAFLRGRGRTGAARAGAGHRLDAAHAGLAGGQPPRWRSPARTGRPACGSFSRLHNSYDSGPVTPEDLQGGRHLSGRRARQPRTASTVLGRAIPLLDKPLFTVSEQFARDLTEDVFQSHVMADHLQEELRPPNVIGVDNGPFASLAVPEEPGLADARRAQPRTVARVEIRPKAACVAALERFVPDEQSDRSGAASPASSNGAAHAPTCPGSCWPAGTTRGRKATTLPPRRFAPFCRSPATTPGRSFSSSRFPVMKGATGCSSCARWPRAIRPTSWCLPFIFQEGYLAALQASAFGVDAVSLRTVRHGERILPERRGRHRPCDGRPAAADRASAIACRRSRPASNAAPAAGTRPPPQRPDCCIASRTTSPTSPRDWQAFNAAGVSLRDRTKTGSPNAEGYRLFAEMAAALERALADAIAIYHRPADASGGQPYFALLVEGIAHIQRSFSWERTAAEYNRHLA
ncbi:MAG: hypothetical protein MZV70_03660 [Desulfobacterales bacterium]|nr:hypothetical protein [Desulfobacterales bacterium]